MGWMETAVLLYAQEEWERMSILEKNPFFQPHWEYRPVAQYDVRSLPADMEQVQPILLSEKASCVTIHIVPNCLQHTHPHRQNRIAHSVKACIIQETTLNNV